MINAASPPSSPSKKQKIEGDEYGAPGTLVLEMAQQQLPSELN
jgi:hypothetical protein